MADEFPPWNPDSYSRNEKIAEQFVADNKEPNRTWDTIEQTHSALCAAFRADLVKKGLIPGGLTKEVVDSIEIERSNVCCGHGDYRDFPRLTAVMPEISVEYKDGKYHLECWMRRTDMGPKSVQQLIELAKKGLQT